MNEFGVDAKAALLQEVPVLPHTPVRWIAVVAENLRPAAVQLEDLRNRHHRSLHLVTVVADVGDAPGVQTDVVAQPAAVVLALDRHAEIFEARVNAHHPVVNLIHRNAWTEQIGSEDNAPVGEPDLAVLDPIGSRLT